MAAVYKSKVLYAKKSSSVFATNVFKKSLNRVKIMQILVARLLPYMFRLLNIVRFQCFTSKSLIQASCKMQMLTKYIFQPNMNP